MWHAFESGLSAGLVLLGMLSPFVAVVVMIGVVVGVGDVLKRRGN